MEEIMNKRILAAIILILCIFMNELNCNVYADKKEKVVVLLYHHLLKENENNNRGNAAIVSVENFEKQMKYVYDNGYETINIESLNNYLKYGTPLPKKSILITFDDGYKSSYDYAYPILKKYKFSASIFIITGLIPAKTQAFNPDRLSYMSKEEIEKSKDVFEFACHTHNLHNIGKNKESILLNSTREKIAEDLKMSKQIIDTKFFSYPYGQFNKQIEGILRDEEFELAFTVEKGVVYKKSEKFELNRVPILNNTSIYEFEEILKRYN